MFVSVVIATRNRSALLVQTLDALARQTWPRERLEILIADNGSTDDTRAVVERVAGAAGAPAIHYLMVATPGKSHAINAALRQARGDLIAFTDDDVLPESNWIERLAAALTETGTDFAAGRILPRLESSPPAWMSSALYGVLAIPDNGPSVESTIPVSGFPTGAVIVSVDVYFAATHPRAGDLHVVLTTEAQGSNPGLTLWNRG